MSSTTTPPPADFSPATFLYLNPEVVTQNDGVRSVEEATRRYADHFSHLHYLLPEPARAPSFSSAVYLAERLGSQIDVSSLNDHVVRAENLLRGAGGEETTADVAGGTHVPNIYSRALLESDGVLVLDDGFLLVEGFRFSEHNVRAGDELRVLKNGGDVVLHLEVLEVLDDLRVRVRDPKNPGATRKDARVNQGATFLVYGIRVADADRIAHINFTRRYGPGGVAEGDADEIPDALDTVRDFNYGLYVTMYPDARFLTPEEAFVSFRNNWHRNDFRVAKASDVVNVNSPVFNTEALSVLEKLEVSGVIAFNGRIIADIRDDHAQQADQVPKDTLLTEYAAKKFVESRLKENTTFGNVTATGDADVRGRLDTADVHVGGTLRCTGSGRADAFLASSRLGVADGDAVPAGWNIADEDVGLVFRDLRLKSHLALHPDALWTLAADRTADGAEERLAFSHRDDGGGVADAFLVLEAAPQDPEKKRRMKVRGDVFVSGAVFSLSDGARKTDLRALDGARALADLRSLRGYTYNLLQPDEHGGEPGIGLLAADVARVFPEAVKTTTANDIEKERTVASVAYGGLVAPLIEAVKHLAARVEDLESRLSSV